MKELVKCIYAGSYVDLQVNSLYEVLRREECNILEKKCDRIRIIDDSGEDYLYPKTWFETF